MRRRTQKIFYGPNRTSANYVRNRRYLLDLAGNDLDLFQPKCVGATAEKLGPAPARLDQHHRRPTRNGKHQTGEARARSYVNPWARPVISKPRQLQGVNNVPRPDRSDGGRRYQVLTLILLDHHRREHRELVMNCTAPVSDHPIVSIVLSHAAMRRAWSSTADSAAGVIPLIREAAASDSGRLVESRATISFESPGTDA